MPRLGAAVSTDELIARARDARSQALAMMAELHRSLLRLDRTWSRCERRCYDLRAIPMRGRDSSADKPTGPPPRPAPPGE